MFTVKHIDTDGTQRLYAAKTVEKAGDVRDDDAAIYLDRTPEGFAHCIMHRGDQSAKGPHPVVYVMNQHGSTVATYHL